jgi:hypothetical protein
VRLPLFGLVVNNRSQAISFVYLRVSSSQNNKAEEPATNSVAANEKNILPNDTPPPAPLENEPASPSEPAPTQIQPSMEVHAHSHTPRKKWTHYLWEFLMLFLAVTLGFFVENQREHLVEHRREKQYMISMLEDLAADTTMINSRIRFATALVNGLDSLQKNLYSDSVLNKAIDVYSLFATYIRIIITPFSDQTATQLRSSGNLRLIRNREIVNAISVYWNAINTIMMTKELQDHSLDEIWESAYEILNRKYVGKPVRDSITGLDIFTIAPDATFMTTDKTRFVALANRINRTIRNIEVFYIPNMKTQKTKAINLILMIKEQYNLK